MRRCRKEGASVSRCEGCRAAQRPAATPHDINSSTCMRRYDHNGVLTGQAGAARTVGTTIAVRDLFNRLPVRWASRLCAPDAPLGQAGRSSGLGCSRSVLLLPAGRVHAAEASPQGLTKLFPLRRPGTSLRPPARQAQGVPAPHPEGVRPPGGGAAGVRADQAGCRRCGWVGGGWAPGRACARLADMWRPPAALPCTHALPRRAPLLDASPAIPLPSCLAAAAPACGWCAPTKWAAAHAPRWSTPSAALVSGARREEEGGGPGEGAPQPGGTGGGGGGAPACWTEGQPPRHASTARRRHFPASN